MTLFKRRSSQKTAPPGAWLAFLAVGIQFLLPFLIAYEIALAGTPAYAGSFTIICSATQNPGGPSQSHHGLSDGCPICTAMAVGQAFTTPSPVALPLPRVATNDRMIVATVARTASIAASPYQSRAPPFFG